MYENEERVERAILVCVDTGEYDAERSLDELQELAATAGAQIISRVIQKKDSFDPATVLGSGRLMEVAEFVASHEIDTVIFDNELSPAQQKNIEKTLDTKVIDRTTLILDIFAQRARTSEGRLQVELAQLRYRLPRLMGMGTSLSRLGGGIGTRGPGETKLEVDRRRVHDRISWLKGELKDVERHREVTRQKRMENHVPVVAIVGYTNAGKSTLLNHLTGAGVLEEDKLFATLDPTTRVLDLPGQQQILLTDTVGFIRKLPHHLIEAFRSTLEEAKYADILVHVVDASNPWMEEQMYVVYETLKELGIENKKIITLFNKMDKLESPSVLRDFKADYVQNVSARTGEGMEAFLKILEEILLNDQVYIERLFPYDQAGQIQIIRSYGQLISEEYTDKGIEVKAYVPMEIYYKVT